jgi:hypothetical protein
MVRRTLGSQRDRGQTRDKPKQRGNNYSHQNLNAHSIRLPVFAARARAERFYRLICLRCGMFAVSGECTEVALLTNNLQQS